ncbi:MAG: imidazole glycerol phosphate synthase cyclase subunit [Actinomycetota bacterium]|nr:imidazole glycerol phosphate synthase cyclase subunit [Actinomycetota bacterium]
MPTVSRVRLIARLDVKGPNLIKGVHLEGLRKVGSPVDFASRYYEEGIDEILVMDVVASLYGRSQLLDIVKATAGRVFVPLTVGGGVRSVDDFEALLRSGADKVAVNTAATREPKLIEDLARRFGSQSVVLSVEALQTSPQKWEAMTDNGRERSGRDVLEWVVEATERGAGEVLVTSIDREGTRTGFDVRLVDAVTHAVSTPVVASGGMGRISDLVSLAKSTDVTGIAMADVLHFGRLSVGEVRAEALLAGLDVRNHD